LFKHTPQTRTLLGAEATRQHLSAVAVDARAGAYEQLAKAEDLASIYRWQGVILAMNELLTFYSKRPT
jgi:uncharacterized protein involved in tolerance to divalent cations